MDIYREPTGCHSPEVGELNRQAFELIHRNPQEAERLLREAIRLEPDAPDLLNNLAAALLGQGREDESHAIVKDIQRRFPDYFFGQVALAHEQIADGDMDAAKKTLGKLMQRSRMHVSEYGAMAECFIRVAVESDDVEDAQAWLQRLEEICPDYHALGKIRQTVAHLAARSRAGGMARRSRLLGAARNWRKL